MASNISPCRLVFCSLFTIRIIYDSFFFAFSNTTQVNKRIAFCAEHKSIISICSWTSFLFIWQKHIFGKEKIRINFEYKYKSYECNAHYWLNEFYCFFVNLFVDFDIRLVSTFLECLSTIFIWFIYLFTIQYVWRTIERLRWWGYWCATCTTGNLNFPNTSKSNGLTSKKNRFIWISCIIFSSEKFCKSAITHS